MKRTLTFALTAMLLLSAAACAAPATQAPRITDAPVTTQAPLAAQTPAATDMPESSQTAIRKTILAAADERRSAIMTAASVETAAGTSYYVANTGDDGNDGLSPETPWRTVARVNEAALRPGDGVFFRRGDLWREVIRNPYADILYSAYGEGEKPAFYGSPENGGGAERWTLLEGTDNIWVYKTPMTMLGCITFDRGKAVASQHLSYWNGSAYTEQGTSDVPVDVRNMKNMRFFVDIDLTEFQKDPEHRLENGDLAVYDCWETGTLYLRCDEGNPGALYSEIEFTTGKVMQVPGGCVMDNLCIYYMSTGVMTAPDSLRGITVQNCEIGFVGDTYLCFRQESFCGGDGGEGFNANGYGNVLKNCYVHHTRDGIVTVELGWDGTIQAGQNRMGGLECTGNLFAYCNNGVGIISFLDRDIDITMDSIEICDNLFLYTGYLEDYTRLGKDSLTGTVLHVYFPDGFWSDLKNTTVHDNVFYLSCGKLMELLNLGRAEIDFSGNTYVQGMYQGAFTYGLTGSETKEYYAADEAAFAEAVRTELGDETSKVVTITEGMENAEIDKAYRLGFVPDGAPADLDVQMTAKELSALLTNLVACRDAGQLGKWEALSAHASESDALLTRGDGMIALYEAALVLGLSDCNRDPWTRFDRMNQSLGDAWSEIDSADWGLFPNTLETGLDPENPGLCLYHLSELYAVGRYSEATNAFLLGYDEDADALHGSDPLTWRMAVNAIVRMTDASDVDTDKDYLVADLS